MAQRDFSDILNFYKGKKVFITGHTGFKGSWLCKILSKAGANITGYALEAPTNPNLFEISNIKKDINSIIGDIKDKDKLFEAFKSAEPEIVFHLAAQPIVRYSYCEPAYTYETNVMGTVNILECIRNTNCTISFLNVTTDKVYHNDERKAGFKEDELLDGFDPYSNSKSCSELVTHCYKKSFFNDDRVRISTARAGNVIGGGDFSKDRIIPDCISAAINKQNILVRNPYSIRPYQHVLEPLFVYLMIAKYQYEDTKYAGYYNVGPNEYDCITTGSLADLFCKHWSENLKWESGCAEGPYEANFLKLDCSKLKSVFNWRPLWNIESAVEKTVEWTKVYLNNGDIEDCMNRQINEFIKY